MLRHKVIFCIFPT